MGVIDDIASRLDPTDVAAAHPEALTLFGLMVGTLQLAGHSQTQTCPINFSPAASRRR
jgi:hypothetical protein